MESAWLDRWLTILADRLSQVGVNQWQMFEPTPSFYASLESGDEGGVASAAEEIGRFILLPAIPRVTYEWGLRMDPKAAGQIRMHGGGPSHIRIPLFYVGRTHALGAILAHELTHEKLASIACEYASVEELERVTDLASIVLGLGKLVLNGLVTDVAASTGEHQVLGYLHPEEVAYAYRCLTRKYGMAESVTTRNLTDAAEKLVSRMS